MRILVFLALAGCSHAPSQCERALGPIADLQTLAGKPLALEGTSDRYGQCSLTVGEVKGRSGYAIEIETSDARNLPLRRTDEESHAYAKRSTLATAAGDASFFVAGDKPAPSNAELIAGAKLRVGKRADPMGDMLGSLPPEQHVVLVPLGDKLMSLRFDRHLFTEDQLKAFVPAAILRAR